MELGQDPFIDTVPDRVGRLRGNLHVGRRISVFVELRILEISSDEMTIVGGQLYFIRVRTVADHLAERGFHFLESEVGEADHRRTSERHSHLFADAKKSGQRQRAVFRRRFFQNSAQASGNPAGNEGIRIAPKIDPRLGVARHFVYEILTDCETALAETFFPDRIGG